MNPAGHKALNKVITVFLFKLSFAVLQDDEGADRSRRPLVEGEASSHPHRSSVCPRETDSADCSETSVPTERLHDNAEARLEEKFSALL